MLEIINKTPFQVALIPCMDRDGYDKAAVVIKGTFALQQGAEIPPLSEVPVPIVWADEFYGEPGTSSVKYESDTAMVKTATDVILVGHAYTHRGRQSSVDVELQVGPLRKRIRVFGDRRWERSLGGWRVTDPEPFERMPLVYERAFGGSDQSDSDPAKHDFERRNPVGTGFTLDAPKDQIKGRTLPNLEDPANLINSWKDRPRPAGVGYIGRNWVPRITYAGTYDETWQRDRCPLLPTDFENRYFQGASPEMSASPYLSGGEAVNLENVSPKGNIRFRLPRRSLSVCVRIQGMETTAEPVLDTVVLEPDESRVTLTWRLTIPCPRKFLYIESLRVSERGAV